MRINFQLHPDSCFRFNNPKQFSNLIIWCQFIHLIESYKNDKCFNENFKNLCENCFYNFRFNTQIKFKWCQSLRFNTQTRLNFSCNFVLQISPKG